MSITIKIENTYEDGHTSEHLVNVDEPEDTEGLDQWWEDEVFQHTGDGHGQKHPKLGAWYAATIMDASDTSLCGLTREWDA